MRLRPPISGFPRRTRREGGSTRVPLSAIAEGRLPVPRHGFGLFLGDLFLYTFTASIALFPEAARRVTDR